MLAGITVGLEIEEIFWLNVIPMMAAAAVKASTPALNKVYTMSITLFCFEAAMQPNIATRHRHTPAAMAIYTAFRDTNVPHCAYVTRTYMEKPSNAQPSRPVTTYI